MVLHVDQSVRPRRRLWQLLRTSLHHPEDPSAQWNSPSDQGRQCGELLQDARFI